MPARAAAARDSTPTMVTPPLAAPPWKPALAESSTPRNAVAPSAAATSSAPTSLRSRPAAWDSQSIRGRRTWPAGEWPSRSAATAYLYSPAMVDSLRVTVAGYSGGFEAAGEHLDVSAPDSEQGDAAVAPCGELAQVQGVSLAGQA